MYQPDTIATYSSGGATYLVTANEGDARAYSGYNEEIRVKDIKGNLDAALLAAYNAVGGDNGLGRLRITNAIGINSTTGMYDKLFAYGSRSFSIWTSSGSLVFDSASMIEKITAKLYPALFNTNSTSNSFDSRSDDKGPEPEALAVGTVGKSTYAFVGLERMGGFMILISPIPRHRSMLNMF